MDKVEIQGPATAAEPTEMRDKGFGIDFILGSFSVVAAVSRLVLIQSELTRRW